MNLFISWDLTTAKRGANKFGNSLYFNVNEYLKDRERITLFSDNFPGQNKNKYMYSIK